MLICGNRYADTRIKVITNIHTYEPAPPWQTSLTTPDIQRAAGWRHEFSAWSSCRTIVSLMVNTRKETAGVPAPSPSLTPSPLCSLFFSLLRAGTNETPLCTTWLILNQGEKHISDCLYQLRICGWWLSLRRPIARVKYVSWSDACNYRACARARMWAWSCTEHRWTPAGR